jgi:hypothetical protein
VAGLLTLRLGPGQVCQVVGMCPRQFLRPQQAGQRVLVVRLVVRVDLEAAPVPEAAKLHANGAGLAAVSLPQLGQ